MTLHRTPTHRDLLQTVAEGPIHLINSRLPFGPGLTSAALYELRAAQLIAVDRAAGTVTITTAGRHALADWSTPPWLRHAS